MTGLIDVFSVRGWDIELSPTEQLSQTEIRVRFGSFTKSAMKSDSILDQNNIYPSFFQS